VTGFLAAQPNSFVWLSRPCTDWAYLVLFYFKMCWTLHIIVCQVFCWVLSLTFTLTLGRKCCTGGVSLSRSAWDHECFRFWSLECFYRLYWLDIFNLKINNQKWSKIQNFLSIKLVLKKFQVLECIGFQTFRSGIPNQCHSLRDKETPSEKLACLRGCWWWEWEPWSVLSSSFTSLCHFSLFHLSLP
jgi:hypothetical protein